ncbi:hypothetical protein ACEQPO_01515 [Bacillus sp. SL00103]
MDRYQTDDIMILNNSFDPIEKQRPSNESQNYFEANPLGFFLHCHKKWEM